MSDVSRTPDANDVRQVPAWVGAMARTLVALVSTVLALSGLEYGFRLVDPEPRTQVLRDNGGPWHLYEHEGVVMWHPQSPGHLNSECVRENPEATVVILVAGSIGVISPKVEETFSIYLQERLGSDWCIMNGSVPAFSPQQKLRHARELYRHFQPDLMIWGDWNVDTEYVRFGNEAIDVLHYKKDAYRYPIPGSLPIPGPLHRRLFDRSAFWRYLVLALFVERHPQPTDINSQNSDFAKFMDFIEQSPSTDGLLVFFASMGQPFSKSLEKGDPPDDFAKAYGAERGFQWVDMTSEWKDEDYLELRIDDCCHLSLAGHKAMADVLEPRLRAWREGRTRAQQHESYEKNKRIAGLLASISSGSIQNIQWNDAGGDDRIARLVLEEPIEIAGATCDPEGGIEFRKRQWVCPVAGPSAAMPGLKRGAAVTGFYGPPLQLAEFEWQGEGPIAGVPCVGPVEFHANGKLKQCGVKQEYYYEPVQDRIEKGELVRFNPDGLLRSGNE